MTPLKRFMISLRHAGNGVRRALAMENSFRIHVAIAIVVVAILLWVGVKAAEAAVLILVIALILTLELVNTVVERFVDLLEPRIHPYVGLIKDMLAAAVLITAIAAVVVGGLILWPYVFPVNT